MVVICYLCFSGLSLVFVWRMHLDTLSFILLSLHLGEVGGFLDVWCALETLNKDRVLWKVLCTDVARWCHTLVVRVDVVCLGPSPLSGTAWCFAYFWFVSDVLVSFCFCGGSNGLVLFDLVEIFSPFIP